MIEISTSVGPARAFEFGTRGGGCSIVASHGAGGGIDAYDLQALAHAGFHGYLVEQPWRVAGKKVAARPAVLDTAWVELCAQLPCEPMLVTAGRSAGARVACRTAEHVGASKVIALSFPLHPPGKPERSRRHELSGVEVPVLVLQGERDAFGTAAEVRAAAGPGVTVVGLPWADHGLHVPKKSGLSESELAQRIALEVRAFLE